MKKIPPAAAPDQGFSYPERPGPRLVEKPRASKPKYQNYYEMQVGVRCVREPSLTKSQHSVLSALSLHCDLGGFGSHPGNPLLQALTRMSRPSVSRILVQLENLRLIQLTYEAGNQHGMASEYRICLEDERFPTPIEVKQTLKNLQKRNKLASHINETALPEEKI